MSASLLEYHVLLALASGPLHGYAIAERVAAESAGALQPRAGSLYRVIARLVARGSSPRARPKRGAAPRPRTPLLHAHRAGRRTLADETQRLKHTAAVAEKRLGLARGRS